MDTSEAPPRRLPAALGLALVAALLAVPAWNSAHAPASPQDEGILVVYPERVLEGDVPNRDFEHLYGPATSWLPAVVFAILEPSVEVERAIGLAYRAALIAGLFFLFRRHDLNAVGGATVAGILLVLRGTTAFPLWAALAALVWSLFILGGVHDHDDASPPTRLFAAGALMTLALAFRVDLGLAVLAAAVLAVRHTPPPRRRVLLAGLAAGTVPLVAHFFIAGPSAFVDGLFLDPVFHQSAGRRLPIETEDLVNLFGLLVAVGAVVLHQRRRGRLPIDVRAFTLISAVCLTLFLQRTDTDHLIYAGVLPLSALGAVVTGTRVKIGARATVLPIVLGLIGLAILPYYLEQTFVSFVQGQALLLPTVALALLVAFQVERSADSTRPWLVGLTVATAFVWALSVFLTYENAIRNIVLARPGSHEVRNAGRTFPLSFKRVADGANAMLAEYGDMPAGTRLFVGPRDLSRTNFNDTFLYFLLPQAEPASYHLEMNPGGANEGTRLTRDIASADVLILTKEYDDWNEPNDSSVHGETSPLDLMKSRFCAIDTFGPYTVFQRKGAAGCGA